MESFNLNNYLETFQENDYILILLSLIFCLLSSFLLMYVYKHKSNSLSSKIQIAPIIPLLSNITFLVILIVKSSLALSLGLVGALSVIRFRTPIKEPEDLAFLFLAIGIGIGYGAFQIYATTIIFLVLMFIIWFFLSNKGNKIKNDFNLVVEAKSKSSELILDEIQNILKNFSIEANFIKLEQKNEIFIIYFNVSFSDTENIKNIVKDINLKIKDVNFSIYENRIID